MKKFYLSIICTAALLAALPLAGCSSMGGNQTTQNDREIITRQSDETCPDENCPNDDCPDCENDKDGDRQSGCPDGTCPDGKENDGNGECPECPKKRKRGRAVAPRGSFREHRRHRFPPKKPVAPPEDDDIILPDPPVEGEQPRN